MALGGLILGTAAIGLTIVKEMTGRRRPSLAGAERWPGGLGHWRGERDRVVAELREEWLAATEGEARVLYRETFSTGVAVGRLLERQGQGEE